MSNRKGQDWALLLVGLWVCASPWVLLDTPPASVALNHLAAGLVVVAMAIARLRACQRWIMWTGVALGGWLALSPFVWGYLGNLSLALSDWVTAVWIAVLSCWTACSAALNRT